MIEIVLDKMQGGFHLSVAFTAEGGVTALFGRSGAGKTSVVAMTAGLSRPDQGRVVVGNSILFDSERNIDVASQHRRIGMVFQDGRLFPHMTVRGNLRYGERRVPMAERYAAFDKVVDLLGIAHLLDRRPARLSGGEKQRVAIGRALLASPRLLLMDEPLAALDGARKAEVLPFIARLSREFSVPILYVSHSIDEIIELADTLVVLEAGQVVSAGGLEQVLSNYDLSSISGRLDVGSIVRASVSEHIFEHGLSRLTLGRTNRLLVPLLDVALGTEVRVRIGAQEIALATVPPAHVSIQNILSGVVRSIERTIEGQVDVRVGLDGDNTLWTRITTMALADLHLNVGDKVFALVKSASIAKGSVVPASSSLEA